ncbi:MAG: sulfotransferase family 2 domain-containing protein [Planctomycetota bacterium]|nr:sulfotransferase family 2 domain-containing protein [Planctomycetota bacterium]
MIADRGFRSFPLFLFNPRNQPQQAPEVIAHPKSTLWFHIHIPKTAGSTLRQILSRNFGNAYFSAVSLMEHHKLSLKNTEEIIEKHYRWLRCYSDHRLSLDLPFDSEKLNVRALAFVRNPVDQVVSQYNFQSGQNRRKTDVAEMTLAEFVEKKFNKPGRASRGLQLQRLRGQINGSSMTDIKRLLDEEKLFLFPLEEFDLAMAWLEKRFSSEFHSTEYLHANRSVKKDLPNADIRSRIRELVEPDFELHDIATWFLSTMASTLFQTPREQKKTVRKLQQRCQSLQKKAAAS